MKEYTATITINQEGHFYIKGRYSLQIIGNTLKKYIKIFLQCDTCKSMRSTIEKKSNRLTYLVCHNDKCNYEKVINYML